MGAPFLWTHGKLNPAPEGPLTSITVATLIATMPPTVITKAFRFRMRELST